MPRAECRRSRLYSSIQAATRVRAVALVAKDSRARSSNSRVECQASRAALASSASWCSDRANPTTRREKMSNTDARCSLPSPVATSVPSPNHFWLGRPAPNRRHTRSGARHRVLNPEGHAALEHVTPHPQLGVLPAQPNQLGPLVLTQPAAVLATAAPVSVDPVPERPIVDTQLPGHLRDRLTRLPDQPNRALLEVLLELPTRLCHRHLP